jgi:hypothetical protein
VCKGRHSKGPGLSDERTAQAVSLGTFPKTAVLPRSHEHFFRTAWRRIVKPSSSPPDEGHPMPPTATCPRQVLDFLAEKVALARSESVRAMDEINSQSDNLRNTVYRMAFANVLLSDALRELFRRLRETSDEGPSAF